MRISMGISGRSGFTLTELLVVMAISGILIIAFGTEFKKWRTKYKTESDTKMLYSLMLEAKIAALKDRQYYFMNLPTGEPNVVRVYKDTEPDGGNGALDTSQDELVREETLTLTPDLLDLYRHFWFNGQGFLMHGEIMDNARRDFQIALAEHDTVEGVEGWYTAFGDYNCLLIRPPLQFGGGKWRATQKEEAENAGLKDRTVIQMVTPMCELK